MNQNTNSYARVVSLVFNGELQRIEAANPTLSVLDWIREQAHETGTKEGCAEGDCGACTVVVARRSETGLQMQSINACITLLPSLHGQALFTVEYLRQQASATGRSLHPVQQSMVDAHASQCGFCTPGFVMSLWYNYNENLAYNSRPARGDLEHALSGNLCRCTGYRPILQAGVQMMDYPAMPFDAEAIIKQLDRIDRNIPLHLTTPSGSFDAPVSTRGLQAILAENPDATLLAGCTDIGLWINKQHRKLPAIVDIGKIPELQTISEDANQLTIGAGVSLEAAFAALCRVYPELRTLWKRFASLPVRNAGTLAGNIANGSPIGDSMPALLALDASVRIVNSDGIERKLALSSLYLGYQQKALAKGEYITSVQVPKRTSGLLLRCYKVSKRFDSDISAVCAGFAITLENDIVTHARLGWGGVAAIPKRAESTEQFLLNKPWNEATLDAAKALLAEEFTPLSDMRASANYRSQIIQNLLYRFYLETKLQQPLKNADVDVFDIDALVVEPNP